MEAEAISCASDTVISLVLLLIAGTVTRHRAQEAQQWVRADGLYVREFAAGHEGCFAATKTYPEMQHTLLQLFFSTVCTHAC